MNLIKQAGMTIGQELRIIGRGTNPNTNNHATIRLDKSVLRGLDRNRPEGGYPATQEQAIAEMRKRVEDYEAVHGEVV
jgi:hypothetical protein